MKVAFFLIISSLLMSQSLETDTVQKEDLEIPPVVKPALEKIMNDTEEFNKVSSELNAEMQKQRAIRKEIRKKIVTLKKINEEKKEVKKIIEEPIPPKQANYLQAIKTDTVPIEYNGNLVRWEYKKQTIFGITIHSAYYPYIIDKNGKVVYIKIK